MEGEVFQVFHMYKTHLHMEKFVFLQRKLAGAGIWFLEIE